MQKPHLIISSIFTFIVYSIAAQSTFDSYAGLELGFPIHTTGVEEGLGLYEINARTKNTRKINAHLNWWLFNNAAITTGAGIQTTGYIIDNQAQVPLIDYPPDYHGKRNLDIHSITPFVGFSLRKGRFRSSFQIVQLFHYLRRKSHSNFSDVSIVGFSPTMPLTLISVSENIRVLVDSNTYTYFQFNFNYKITERLNCHVGYETSLFNNPSKYYSLTIREYPEAHPEDAIYYNSFFVDNEFKAINAGVSYMIFGLK